MWRIVTILVMLIFGVTGWLGYELGIILPSPVMAAEKPDNSLESIQKSIQDREKSLDSRTQELTRKEQAVSDKEKILNQQMERYEKVIADLRSRLTQAEGVNDEKYISFRRVYEKMEPKKAAKILDEMEPGMASRILTGMQGDRAAELLTHMSPDKARLLTEKILGKRIVSSSKPGDETKAAEDVVDGKGSGDASQKGGAQ